MSHFGKYHIQLTEFYQPHDQDLGPTGTKVIYNHNIITLFYKYIYEMATYKTSTTTNYCFIDYLYLFEIMDFLIK